MIRFTFIFLLFTSFSFSQKTYEYLGLAKLNDTTALTYRIVFEENDGQISGYSLTDFGGDHETKSNLSGTYDNDKKRISFKESGIIYTKSSFVKNDFCFINVESVKFRLGRSKSLIGPFLGRFKDGTKCIDGEVYLQAVERVEKFVNKLSKKVDKSKVVDAELKSQFQSMNIMDSLRLNILKPSQVTSFFTKDKTVKLKLFDGAKIDNDITTVYVNEKVILEAHKSTHDIKELIIPVTAEVTEIRLVSNSVGTLGLNTTIVEIVDSKNEITAMTNLDKGDTTTINIIRSK